MSNLILIQFLKNFITHSLFSGSLLVPINFIFCLTTWCENFSNLKLNLQDLTWLGLVGMADPIRKGVGDGSTA
jgi:magnesium-transporting ATPase (P-type)